MAVALALKVVSITWTRFATKGRTAERDPLIRMVTRKRAIAPELAPIAVEPESIRLTNLCNNALHDLRNEGVHYSLPSSTV